MQDIREAYVEIWIDCTPNEDTKSLAVWQSASTTLARTNALRTKNNEVDSVAEVQYHIVRHDLVSKR